LDRARNTSPFGEQTNIQIVGTQWYKSDRKKKKAIEKEEKNHAEGTEGESWMLGLPGGRVMTDK